jgi:serine/threonine protein kinase
MVTDFGEDEHGIVFLVMEFLKGRTLKDVIRSEGPMPLSRVLEIVRQVAGALEAAHSMGVVHRDLKSDNIMLEDLPGDGEWAKVLDFGIAKIQKEIGEDSTLTEPNIVIGTPHYMSPEQCTQSSDIDARSDIYSLAIIIYEMLAGHVPFTGDSPTEIMVKQIQEFAPSILDERPDLPEDIDSAITRALAKNPNYRYQSATEFADALLSASGYVPSKGFDSAQHDSSEHETDNAFVASDEEITLISPNVNPAATANKINVPLPGTQKPRVPSPGPMPTNFNPQRIAAVGGILLVLVFGGYYAYTSMSRSSDSNQTQPPQILLNDPQSRPVKVAGPPSGISERNLKSRPVLTNTNVNQSMPSDPSLDDQIAPVLPPSDITIMDAGTEPPSVDANETSTTDKKNKDDNKKNKNTSEKNTSQTPDSQDHRLLLKRKRQLTLLLQ